MASAVTAIVLTIALMALMFAAVRLLVLCTTDNADKAMDFHNVHHIRHMINFGDDTDIVLTYIVPKERTLWEKLTRRVGVWAWECDFFGSDVRRCKRYVTVSTSAYFYMKLKGWTETADKELAQKAMDYMKWEREIP